MTSTELNTIITLINREVAVHTHRADTLTNNLKVNEACNTAMELLVARDALEDMVNSR